MPALTALMFVIALLPVAPRIIHVALMAAPHRRHGRHGGVGDSVEPCADCGFGRHLVNERLDAEGVSAVISGFQDQQSTGISVRSATELLRPFDQLPVRPRAQNWRRTKPRNGKSRCALRS
jgi:hypothetical protein